MGIFDQAPPAPNQQPGTPPQQQPQYPPAQPSPQQWGQPQQPAMPSWPMQPPAQGNMPPAYPFTAPPGAFPPTPQGYAPPAYGQQPTPQVPPVGYGAPPAGYASPFDSVQGAEVYGARVPFWNQGDDGTYAVIVMDVRRFQARKGKIDTFALEEKIIFSSNPRVPPGAARCKMEQANKDGADGRVKKMMLALGGGATVDDAAYHASYGPDQPFRGTILIVEANGVPGKPYMNHERRWPSVEELRKLAALAQQVDPTWRPAPLQAALLR